MELSYCGNCEKKTGHKRSTSFATFFAVIITMGIWIFAIPFYPKRCIICGMTKGDGLRLASAKGLGTGNIPLIKMVGWALLIVVIVLTIFGRA